MYGCLAVLRHDESVLVVFVGHGERTLLQSVEQPFLCVAVVIEGLVVVDVIPREVGEQRAVEIQSGDTLLRDGVGGDLHERVFASGVHHPSQQTVQLNRVRRRVRRRNGFVLDIIDHGGQQTCLVSQRAHEFI